MQKQYESERESHTEFIPGGASFFPPLSERSEVSVGHKPGSSESRTLLQGGHMHIMKVKPLTFSLGIFTFFKVEPSGHNKTGLKNHLVKI